MVTEDLLIIQQEIVITNFIGIAQRIIKGTVQMIVLLIHLHNIPRMAIFHAFFGVIFRKGDDTPDIQGIT